MPGGAAASVVLLQDKSTDMHEPALPEAVRAATAAFAAANGGAAAPTQLAALQALELRAKQDTATLRSEGLPPQLHEALLADAQQASGFGALEQLDALLQPEVAMPPDVGAAAAAAFAAERGRSPASEAETLAFLKEARAQAPEAQRAAAAFLAPLQAAAPEAASGFAGAATLDVAPQSP